MRREEFKAFLVLVLVVAALGICGWYENYVPAPEVASRTQANVDGERLP